MLNINWKNFTGMLVILCVSVPQFSCHTNSRTKGAAIGAAIGAATGVLTTKNNRAVGLILGAGIGGVAGGLIGHYMDEQAAEIRRDLEGAKVERVGEGIVVTFDSGLLFDFDSDALKSETRVNLQRLASTLKKYEETDVVVFGHTDSSGSEPYNLELSESRASAVADYLKDLTIPSRRLKVEGLGEVDPLASNETETGRQINRRVELTILASKKLIRDAKRGDVPEAS